MSGGVGLLVGLELVESRENRKPAPELAAKIVAEGMRRRVMVPGTLGTNIIRLAPPLVITEEHVTRCLSIFDEVLGKVTSDLDN